MPAAPDPQKLINQWIPGGYRIRKFIGAGAFAWVYYATDQRNTGVAIKVLQADSHEARTLFTREIKILRALPANPYCVRYIDDGTTDDGQPFLVMEFIDGATLKDTLKFKQNWEPDEACRVILQVCEALSGLHKYGLAHRDLKPENIMLTRDWQVRLMDFGLVKDAQGLLKLFEEQDIFTGRDFAENVDRAMLAGTPEYMAPEQFSDPMAEDASQEKTDTWTDVYSVALILYQLLTSEKLFAFRPTARDQAAYARELLAYVRQRATFDDAALLRHDAIPTALWPVLVSALRQNPKQRPYNALALADLIHRYLETGEVGSDFDDEGESTFVADMSQLVGALHANKPKPAAKPAPAGQPKPDDRTRPVDVGAVQAYRNQRLNKPGGADFTLPPGQFNAKDLPAHVQQALASAETPGNRPTVPPPQAVAPKNQPPTPVYGPPGYPPQTASLPPVPVQPPPPAYPPGVPAGAQFPAPPAAPSSGASKLVLLFVVLGVLALAAGGVAFLFRH